MIFKRKKSDSPSLGRPLWVWISACVTGVVLLVLLGVAWYWSRMPDLFWVNQKPGSDGTVVGYATADTLVRVAGAMLDKPGGYLTNDMVPPGVFLDNIPNWEFGVLQQVRDLARIMRNDYSRSQSQSREDADIAATEPKFFFDNDSWILPRTESEYRDAIQGFEKYRDRLSETGNSGARFFARADNLREWLAQVEKRLDSLTRRLGDSATVSRPMSSTRILPAIVPPSPIRTWGSGYRYGRGGSTSRIYFSKRAAPPGHWCSFFVLRNWISRRSWRTRMPESVSGKSSGNWKPA
jgi:hypothetical protein